MFYGRVLGIEVSTPEIIDVPAPEVTKNVSVIVETRTEIEVNTNPVSGTESVSISQQTQPVSALSLSSIRAKKELEQSQRDLKKDTVHLPTESFSETDMLLQWNKYAQRLGDKGHKIMESLLLINDPKLQGTTIVHELPNESSKIDFESGKHDLVGYLRGKLHNHDLDIRIVVNEAIDSRKAFTPQDRYNRLNELNPNLDTLRRTFDLDF